jgi:hypothetical protein
VSLRMDFPSLMFRFEVRHGVGMTWWIAEWYYDRINCSSLDLSIFEVDLIESIDFRLSFLNHSLICVLGCLLLPYTLIILLFTLSLFFFVFRNETSSLSPYLSLVPGFPFHCIFFYLFLFYVVPFSIFLFLFRFIS